MGRVLIAGTGVVLGFVTAFLALGALLLAEATALSPETSLEVMNAAAWVGGSVAGGTGALLWSVTIVVCFVPILAVALLGEAARARSLAWYAGGTGAITAALPSLVRAARDAVMADPPIAGRITLLLFLTGVASGLVYWLVAGRSAGSP